MHPTGARSALGAQEMLPSRAQGEAASCSDEEPTRICRAISRDAAVGTSGGVGASVAGPAESVS
jgi:hypothetical protein